MDKNMLYNESNVSQEEEFLLLWEVLNQVIKEMQEKSKAISFFISGNKSIQVNEDIVNISWRLISSDANKELTLVEAAKALGVLADSLATVYRTQTRNSVSMRLSEKTDVTFEVSRKQKRR